MAKFLITGTHGPANPTRASFPFQVAKGAIEAGFDVAIVLAHDGSLLMKEAIREPIVGIGLPPLKELFQFVLEHKVQIYVRGGCAKARGISKKDLEGKNARFIDRVEYARLIVESEKVLTF